MAKSRAVEHDHSVVFRRQINQSTRLEILDHAAVAVKQDQRPTVSAFHIVETDPIDVDEPPSRGIVALRLLRKLPVYDRCRGQNTRCRSECGFYGIFPENG
jgi:hypothetical protein